MYEIDIDVLNKHKPYTLATECCALNMLRAAEGVTFKELKQEVERNKAAHENKDIKSFIGVKKGIGARALFCIVSSNEDTLEKHLKKLGFEFQFEFGRRRGYNPGNNKFYVLKW